MATCLENWKNKYGNANETREQVQVGMDYVTIDYDVSTFDGDVAEAGDSSRSLPCTTIECARKLMCWSVWSYVQQRHTCDRQGGIAIETNVPNDEALSNSPLLCDNDIQSGSPCYLVCEDHFRALMSDLNLPGIQQFFLEFFNNAKQKHSSEHSPVVVPSIICVDSNPSFVSPVNPVDLMMEEGVSILESGSQSPHPTTSTSNFELITDVGPSVIGLLLNLDMSYITHGDRHKHSKPDSNTNHDLVFENANGSNEVKSDWHVDMLAKDCCERVAATATKLHMTNMPIRNIDTGKIVENCCNNHEIVTELKTCILDIINCCKFGVTDIAMKIDIDCHSTSGDNSVHSMDLISHLLDICGDYKLHETFLLKIEAFNALKDNFCGCLSDASKKEVNACESESLEDCDSIGGGGHILKGCDVDVELYDMCGIIQHISCITEHLYTHITFPMCPPMAGYTQTNYDSVCSEDIAIEDYYLQLVTQYVPSDVEETLLKYMNDYCIPISVQESYQTSHYNFHTSSNGYQRNGFDCDSIPVDKHSKQESMALFLEFNQLLESSAVSILDILCYTDRDVRGDGMPICTPYANSPPSQGTAASSQLLDEQMKAIKDWLAKCHQNHTILKTHWIAMLLFVIPIDQMKHTADAATSCADHNSSNTITNRLVSILQLILYHFEQQYYYPTASAYDVAAMGHSQIKVESNATDISNTKMYQYPYVYYVYVYIPLLYCKLINELYESLSMERNGLYPLK